jgi:hypothetical protein
MGRNIFQCKEPVAMVQAVRSIVHGRQTPAHAHELYLSLSAERTVSEHA